MSKFSVLNESSLHNTLKIYYSQQTNGKTEVELNGHVYDILTEDNQVIEIQTKNLSKLKEKIKDTIDKGLKIKLVYPIPVTTTIVLTDENGKLISSRKSPKKGSSYDIFKEITGLTDILLKPEFTLEIIFIEMTEHRVKTDEAVQTQNKKRRFKKDWIKVNKKLNEIINIKQLTTPQDYLNFLPAELDEEFCAKDIKNILKEKKSVPVKIYNNTNLIIWVLNKMKLIEFTQTKSRSKYYRIIK